MFFLLPLVVQAELAIPTSKVLAIQNTSNTEISLQGKNFLSTTKQVNSSVPETQLVIDIKTKKKIRKH